MSDLTGKLECPMCGALDAFTIDPNDGSRGYCSVEDKTWVVGLGPLGEALALCWAIERLPASPQQTDISIKASALRNTVERLIQERNELQTELDWVDEALARRPALDSYITRYEKICTACDAAGKAEQEISTFK